MTSPTPPVTPVEAEPGPRLRSIRTILQTIIAVALAIPSAVVLVPIPDKFQGYVALVVGLAGAAVVLVTAAWNAVEARRGLPLIGPSDQLTP